MACDTIFPVEFNLRDPLILGIDGTRRIGFCIQTQVRAQAPIVLTHYL